MSIQDLYELYLSCDCRVSTDSRSISGGELFFALRGDNFNGNAFAIKALESGAAWAIVDDASLPSNPRIIKVSDAFSTLQQLAIHHRQSLKGLTVLGITGTNGKTTTKNLIHAVLSQKYLCSATIGNLNNDIGVPLTLLSIRPGTQIAIVEMGANHPDDISKLVRVCQPDCGLITNVGKAHLQGFGSLEGVKAAKGELYKYLGSVPRSRIFINEDDPTLKEMSSHIPCHFYGYGLAYDGAVVLPASPEQPYLRVQLRDALVSTRLVGSYNATNALAALAVGEYFGVERSSAIRAIESFTPTNKRSQIEQRGSNTLIIDAYNANPSSMAAALDNFLSSASEHKLALLGDMKELGADSAVEHKAVIQRLMQSKAEVMLVGPEFAAAARELSCTYPCFESSSDLASFLSDHRPGGCLILLKGSRSTAMEKVLDVL